MRALARLALPRRPLTVLALACLATLTLSCTAAPGSPATPASVGGALLLVLADLGARTIVQPAEISLRLARELAAAGSAVLQDVNLAATYADRVLLLRAGRLVASGDPWQVLTPERLEPVFELPFHLDRHPFLDRPLLVPVPLPAPAPAAVVAA